MLVASEEGGITWPNAFVDFDQHFVTHVNTVAELGCGLHDDRAASSQIGFTAKVFLWVLRNLMCFVRFESSVHCPILVQFFTVFFTNHTKKHHNFQQSSAT